MKKKSKVIDVSRATFISVCIILFVLMLVSVLLTHLLPRGEFAAAGGVTDYGSYVLREDLPGLPLWKGLLAPFLILGSEDALTLVVLSVFLLIVSGSFQVLMDSLALKELVSALARRLGRKRRLMILALAFIFMVFGSFFGLFEETLPMVPLVVLFSLSVGYDGFTGFLASVASACLGFAAGITNPFTVVLASDLIGTSVTEGILFRCFVFLVMFALDAGFILLHLKRIEKDPEASPTRAADLVRRGQLEEETPAENAVRLRRGALILLTAAFLVTVLFSLSDALRGYTVPAVAAVYLLGILLFSPLSGFGFKNGLKSFGQGILAALPTILFIFMASSVKYILTEGHVLPTIAHGINGAVAGTQRLGVVYILLGIILVLEFFISSSTAKAIFVMGILSCLTVSLSRPLLVLVYLFGDGYTNLFFPTSPVLWIGLSMIGLSYGKWLKKSALLWTGIIVLTAALLALAVAFDPIR